MIASSVRARLFCALLAACTGALHAQDKWVGTWEGSPVASNNPQGVFNAPLAGDATLREIMQISLGGSAFRVVFTNEFGTEPLHIDAAQIGRKTGRNDVDPATLKPLLFAGKKSVVIAPGQFVASDAAMLTLPPLADVAVTFYLPKQAISQLSVHRYANATNYVIDGDVIDGSAGSNPRTNSSWAFVKGIDVRAAASAGAIVAFGDSITDGERSSKDANARYPSVLARRLQADPKTAGLAVLDAGIGGNRVLRDGGVAGESALKRFDRDVLAQAGVKYVIVLESINDINAAYNPRNPHDPASASDLIDGLTKLTRQAHKKDLKVYGGTVLAYGGSGPFSPAGEEVRQAVNKWIRTTREFDGVIDFEKATQDPANPDKLLPAYDSGDHLHPSDKGYNAMGECIDLKLFERK